MKGFVTIYPVDIQADGVLLDSNVPEDDYPEWVSGTNYTQFDRVIHGRYIYETGATGVSEVAPPTDPSRWIVVNPINRWRPFAKDQIIRMRQAGHAWYLFAPGQVIDSIWFADLQEVNSVRIQIIDPETDAVVDERTLSVGWVPADKTWWEFYFGTWKRAAVPGVQTGFAWRPNYLLRIDFHGSNDMAVGPIVFGRQFEWGLGVQTGLSMEPTDYSRNKTDEYGRIKFVKLGWAKGATFAYRLSSNELDDMYEHFIDLRGIPVPMIACERWRSTMFYGFLTFRVEIPDSNHPSASITVKGLVDND